MKCSRIWATIVVAIVAVPGRSAWSASSTAPATGPASAETAPAVGQLTGSVTAVQGLVQVRDPEHPQWQACTVGMIVREGTEFRTGPRSRITFELPPHQVATVDRLTTVQVLLADHPGALQYRTDLGMKYGRTEYQIETAGLEYHSTIRSPNSTLAVRGTVVSLYDQRPFAPEAVSFTGRALYTAGKRQIAFGGKNAGRQTVRGEQSAAAVALAGAVVDPTTPFARTAAEVPLITNLRASGAVVTLLPGSHIPIVSGGVPPSDQQLMRLLPGVLDVVLRWNANANLNLVVGNQVGSGEALLPVSGLNNTASGGRIPFDHVGGPNGGIEIAYWAHTFPQSIYFIGIDHISGVATPFTVDVFNHGSRVPIFDPSANGGAGQFVNSLSGVSSPGQGVVANAYVNVPIPPIFLGSSAVKPARTGAPVRR